MCVCVCESLLLNIYVVDMDVPYEFFMQNRTGQHTLRSAKRAARLLLLITCSLLVAHQLHYVPKLSVHLIVIYRYAHSARRTCTLTHTRAILVMLGCASAPQMLVECSNNKKNVKLDLCINGKLLPSVQCASDFPTVRPPTYTKLHTHIRMRVPSMPMMIFL